MTFNRQFLLIKLPFYVMSIASLFLVDINWMITFAFWFLISVIGVNITMHRYISHRSFEFKNDLIKAICIYLGSVSIQSPTSYWALQHGHHHKHTDSIDDVHSPRHGFLKSFFTWQWGNDILNVKITNTSVYRQYLRDRMSMFFDRYYTAIIWLTALIAFLVSPTVGTAFVLASTLSSIQIGLINYFCHYKDGVTQTTNRTFLKYLLFGEGLHKNHHDRPGAFDFSDGENVDLSGKMILLMKKP